MFWLNESASCMTRTYINPILIWFSPFSYLLHVSSLFQSKTMCFQLSSYMEDSLSNAVI
jgi:hypothetical protein